MNALPDAYNNYAAETTAGPIRCKLTNLKTWPLAIAFSLGVTSLDNSESNSNCRKKHLILKLISGRVCE